MFPNIFLNKKPHSPTPAKNSQNIRLPHQTQKNICLLVALPHWRDYSRQFRLIRARRVPRRHLRPRIVGINKLPQKSGLIPPAPKIDYPNFTNIETSPKILTTDMHNLWIIPSMSVFSKLSDQNPNLQLLFAEITSTVTTKFQS